MWTCWRWTIIAKVAHKLMVTTVAWSGHDPAGLLLYCTGSHATEITASTHLTGRPGSRWPMRPTYSPSFCPIVSNQLETATLIHLMIDASIVNSDELSFSAAKNRLWLSLALVSFSRRPQFQAQRQCAIHAFTPPLSCTIDECDGPTMEAPSGQTWKCVPGNKSYDGHIAHKLDEFAQWVSAEPRIAAMCPWYIQSPLSIPHRPLPHR